MTNKTNLDKLLKLEKKNKKEFKPIMIIAGMLTILYWTALLGATLYSLHQVVLYSDIDTYDWEGLSFWCIVFLFIIFKIDLFLIWRTIVE